MADIATEQLLLLAFGLLVVGALVTALFGRDWRRTGWTAAIFVAAASAALWTLAARAISTGDSNTRALLNFELLGSALTFHIDSLSATFLLVVPFVALAATVYAIEYMRKVHPAQYPGRYYPFALLLMAAVVGVVTTSDLFFFFVFWEMMTLTSWALVWFEREDETRSRAAWKYFVVTHVAAACILVAAIIIYAKSGSFAFPDVARAIGQIAAASPGLAHLLMALLLIGFATKAGMFPLGGWLPDAYPAAPAPASAAFAGSMTKLGIYGVVRAFFELFQAPGLTAVWGGIIATLGAASIFVGTLTALQEQDSKRLLSFHIIGQIGYMLLGIGVGLYFVRSSPALATVALMAGLYHLVNNACYKSLLFLNVGAAEYQTGSRNLNDIGGLGRLMPVTMAAAIVASLSIAGIPPFNGFVSKWLIYQSAFNGGMQVPFFLLLGLVAMFISLVTLASFMKLIGAIFLGKLATAGRSVTGEVPLSMRAPQLGLAATCILLGALPILPLKLLYGAARDVLGASYSPTFAALFGVSASGVRLSFGPEAAGGWNPAHMTLALVLCGLVAYAISRAGRAASRETDVWLCGEEYEDEHVRFRAHGFVMPFKQAFANVYPSVRAPRIGALRLLSVVFDLDSWLYTPLVNGSARAVQRVSRTHSGLPHVYMLWQVAGVVVVLAVLFLVIK